MKWLIEQAAELVSWKLEKDSLMLEVVLSSDGDLPIDPEPVVLVRLVDPEPPDSLNSDLEELSEYLWAIGTEDVDGRTIVTLEGEGYSVPVPCRQVTVERRPLERRHFERVIRRHKEQIDCADAELQRCRSTLRRVEVFLEQQATRAERIVNEVSPSHPDARLRAEARLGVVNEIGNILKAKESS